MKKKTLKHLIITIVLTFVSFNTNALSNKCCIEITADNIVNDKLIQILTNYIDSVSVSDSLFGANKGYVTLHYIERAKSIHNGKLISEEIRLNHDYSSFDNVKNESHIYPSYYLFHKNRIILIYETYTSKRILIENKEKKIKNFKRKLEPFLPPVATKKFRIPDEDGKLRGKGAIYRPGERSRVDGSLTIYFFDDKNLLPVIFRSGYN